MIMPNKSPSVEDEITQVERRWVQAHRDIDLATIDEILAETTLRYEMMV